MVHFSAGDSNNASKAFFDAIDAYKEPKQGELFPYEEDFILLFLILFPTLLEHEQGALKWKNNSYRPYLTFLKRKARNRNFSARSISKLILARCESYQMVSQQEFSDRALKSSRLAGERLVEMLVQYWFGTIGENQNQERVHLSPS